MLMASPHASRPFHKLDARRGVWVGNQWYRHPAMDTVKKGTRVEVRVEPWLYNVIYVHIGGKWHAAIGNNPRAYVGRGRREVQIAFREQTRLSAVKANQDSISPETLRKKRVFLRPEHYDERINRQQYEMRYLFKTLGMTTALAPLPEALLDDPSQAALDATLPSLAVTALVVMKQTGGSQPAEQTLEQAYGGDVPTQSKSNEGPSSGTGIYDDMPGYH